MAAQLVVLAGPNGAGKSTLAPPLLRDAFGLKHYVNADTLARGLSAFDPESAALDAGRIMLERLRKLAARRETFGFETTLATRSFAPWIAELRGEGYEFHLVYVWLDSADVAVQRVAERVRRGGHHVPEEVIRRRYQRGIDNFLSIYRPIADTWAVRDNSRPPRATDCGRDSADGTDHLSTRSVV